MKKLFGFLFITAFASLTAGNYDLAFYNAFMASDVKTWEETLKKMDAELLRHPNDSLRKNTMKARIGLLYLYSFAKEEDKAENELKIAQQNLEILLEKYPDDAVLWANRTTLVGFGIWLKPYKVMIYGPRSLEYITKARELNRHLPEVMIEYGNTKYNTPSFAGGNKDLGMRQYRDAIAKMVGQQENYKNDWYFLMVHLNYANMLIETDQKQEAINLYQWLFKYEPRYKRLTKELIPNLQKKIKGAAT